MRMPPRKARYKYILSGADCRLSITLSSASPSTSTNLVTSKDQQVKDQIIKFVPRILIGLVALIFVFGSFDIISPSERAVKVTMGTVAPQVYGPGVQFKLPLVTHFETASVQPVTQDVVIEVGPKGAVSADNQTIGLTAKVAWTYDTTRVMELVKQYPNRGVLEDLVNNTAYEALKAEIGKYTIFDLAKNAGKIASEARNAAATKVKSYPVLITQVNLTNWDWSDDFDAQIKATMNTTQRVAQAKAEADRVEQEQPPPPLLDPQ